MFEPPSIVRFVVILYILLGGFAAILLWRNAAAPTSLQNSGIILAGLLPALIAVLPYLRGHQLSKDVNLTLFFNESTKQVITSGLLSPYSRAYSSMFANLNQEDFKARKIEDSKVPKGNAKQYFPLFHKETGFNLVERLVLISLIDKFHNHWDIEFHSNSEPTG